MSMVGTEHTQLQIMKQLLGQYSLKIKKLKRENKLKIGIITLDVSKIKKVCTPKAYDFIMNACEGYKKDFKNFISRIAI